MWYELCKSPVLNPCEAASLFLGGFYPLWATTIVRRGLCLASFLRMSSLITLPEPQRLLEEDDMHCRGYPRFNKLCASVGCAFFGMKRMLFFFWAGKGGIVCLKFHDSHMSCSPLRINIISSLQERIIKLLVKHHYNQEGSILSFPSSLLAPQM